MRESSKIVPWALHLQKVQTSRQSFSKGAPHAIAFERRFITDDRYILGLSDEYMIETEAGHKAAKSLRSLRERPALRDRAGTGVAQTQSRGLAGLQLSGETLSPY